MAPPAASVTLVSTYHEESGAVNVEALAGILESLRPEVIFLEIPPDVFADYDQGLRGNLESTAARRHRDSHDVTLVPVDLPTPDASFFYHDKELHRHVERVSPDYRHLIDQHRLARMQHGFSYLNSDDCSEAWSRINTAIVSAVERLPDRPSLLEHLASAARIYESRDTAMLANIETFQRHSAFSTGALLVGAAHRRSLICKSRERPQDAPQITWSAFDGAEWRGITTA